MKMVTHLFTDAGRTWRQAAKVNSRGSLIYKALMEEMNGPLGGIMAAQIQRNAQYIKDVPADIARQMTEHIMSQSMQGLRHTDIAKNLQQLFPHMTDVKANLIARTETAKTATALTQSRCELHGIPWYRWRTSEDSRVRDSHRIMDKVLVAWDDPPSPEELSKEKDVGHYHAGCIWNCRCYAEPLIDLDFIQWPCQVYLNGSLRKMSRKQFEHLMPIRNVG
ncbi:phage head morphogenesis protein [Alicyclobacillus suci]|uniref:phage head morphogenesis protein n=1 Tax=Alicyclobacillus suci TaxID=2816080 RepID=UPI001A8F142D|nr:phage minor head protein [Alicyclobacillus suci]